MVYRQFTENRTMAEVGQLAIETMDLAALADKRARRGLALTMLRPDTDAKVIKVKMAQHMHQALAEAEDALRAMRIFTILVSGKVNYTDSC